jgi:hypothetical protein
VRLCVRALKRLREGNSYHLRQRIRENRQQGDVVIRARFLLRLGLAIFVTAAHSAQGSGQEPTVARHTVEASSSHAKARSPKPGEATRAILGAFDRYEVVGMGAGHGNKDLDDLILRVVRDPAFPNKVNDIVVECGNSLYQPVLDRYIAGEDVPLSEVRQVWRNSQTMCTVSGFYEILFPLVRRINQRVSPDKRLRVLAGDPPVDWSKVKSPSDLDGMRDRDAVIASVMEKEVLSKHRKALMLFGTFHLFHSNNTGPKWDESAVQLYEKTFPRVTFVIGDFMVFDNSTVPPPKAELEAQMAAWPVPSLVQNIKGTWLGEMDKYYFSKMVDAYLYLGPSDLMLVEPRPAEIFSNKEYMAELQRRAAIIGDPLIADQTNPDKLSDQNFDPFLYHSNDEQKILQSLEIGPSPSAVPPKEGPPWRIAEIPQVIHLSPEALTTFAGKYAPESPTGVSIPPIEVTADQDGLWIDLRAGTGKHKFVPISRVDFMEEDKPATRVTFHQDEKAEIVGLAFRGLWTSEATKLH